MRAIRNGSYQVSVIFIVLSFLQSSSHFVSAKTDDLINAMFLRITADILGIKLTGADMERASTVVKADIVQYDDQLVERKKAPVKRIKSSFCVLQ